MKLENGGPQEWCNITVETQSEVGDNVGILAKSSTFTTQCGSCTYNGRDNSYKTTKKGKGTAAKSSWEAHHNGGLQAKTKQTPGEKMAPAEPGREWRNMLTYSQIIPKKSIISAKENNKEKKTFLRKIMLALDFNARRQ